MKDKQNRYIYIAIIYRLLNVIKIVFRIFIGVFIKSSSLLELFRWKFSSLSHELIITYIFNLDTSESYFQLLLNLCHISVHTQRRHLLFIIINQLFVFKLSLLDINEDHHNSSAECHSERGKTKDSSVLSRSFHTILIVAH